MDEKATRAIAAELKKYPENTELVWGDMHKLITENTHTASWVDVKIPELCAKLKYNWLVTLISPEIYDEEEEKPWPIHSESALILVEPDKTVWSVWNEQEMWHREESIIVKNYNETPSKKELEILETIADQYNEQIKETSAWSNEQINKTLHTWTYAQTGRSDLTYTFSNDIGEEMMEELNKKIDNQETYKIAENIEVTSDAFQQLLDLPSEEAIEIINVLKEATKNLKNQKNSEK
jgi:hypothetical protein